MLTAKNLQPAFLDPMGHKNSVTYSKYIFLMTVKHGIKKFSITNKYKHQLLKKPKTDIQPQNSGILNKEEA